jgi:phosphatidate cytidylyltransferase
MAWMSTQLTSQQQLLPQLIIYGLSVIFWVLVVPAWLMIGWKPRNPWLMALVGWLLLLPTGLAMLDLRAENPWWLLAVMGLVWMADISAYFAGRKFGKNKLAPSISPGKTWEGVAGALLGVAVYVVVALMMTGEPRNYGLIPHAIVAAWWWAGLAIIGDLFESAVKRQAGVKDSGALLPGHGGLLDRIDALTSTLPLAALALILQRLV